MSTIDNGTEQTAAKAAVTDAYEVYKGSQRQVTLAYANRGKITDDLHGAIMAVLRQHKGAEHAGEVSVGWIEHELCRTNDWIKRLRETEKKARKDWYMAKINAGEMVSDKMRQELGLPLIGQPDGGRAND